jgi:hypothetical protein
MDLTIDFLIEYQSSIVTAIRSNGNAKNLHVEEQILRVLKEHRQMHSEKANGLVVVEMTQQRYRKISEIY